MNRKLLILSTITAGILFSGCGGGGSSSSTSTTKSISGIVSDPEIKEAQVQLCEKADITTCLNVSDTTNTDGVYSLNVDKNLNLQDYIIVAKNGIDTKTGMDFSGFTFKAPANLPTDGNKLIISPLTTMIANKVEEGDTLEEALTKTSTNLGLSKDKLKMNPTKDKDLQKVALVISSIKKLTNKKFSEITISDGKINDFIETLTDMKQKNQLKTTLELINEETDTKQMIKSFTSFQELLQTEEINAFDKTDINVFKNIKKAAKKVAKAFENRENVSLNQIRKVISLVDKTDYTNENKVIADIDTSSIDLDNNDSKIVDVKNELNTPITDIDKLREYYYSSNISYINQAEQIVKNVSDIATTDTIYLGIAKTYLENNDVAKAKDYLNNKIFKTSTKNKLKLAIAKRLVIQNTPEAKTNALNLYKEVFVSIKKIYDGKKIERNAAVIFSDLLQGFSTLQDKSSLNELNTYITNKKNELTSFRDYTNIVNGLRTLANNQIQNNEDPANTEEIVDLAYQWAKEIPEFRGSYMLRLIYLTISVGDIYTKLEKFDKAKDVADVIKQTRANSAMTKLLTDGEAVSAMRYYVNAKEYDEAKNMIDSISNARYKKQAYEKYSLAVYKNEGYAKALKYINDNITDNKIKRSALTNKGIVTLAIEGNNLDDAKNAIAEATKLLDEDFKASTYNPSTDNARLFASDYIQQGYIRYANFYEQLNEDSLRDSMIEKAEKFFEKYNGYEFTQAYTYLINTYIAKNDVAKATQAYNNAVTNYVSTATTKVSEIGSYIYLVSLYKQNDKLDISSHIDSIFDLVKNNENINALYKFKDNTTDSGVEGQKAKRAELFMNISTYYNRYKLKDKVKKSLDESLALAKTLTNTQYKYDFFFEIVEKYSQYGYVNDAIALANTFEFRSDKREALASISKEIKAYDAFPGVKGATIDHDNDGKLDFYDYGYGSSTVNIPLDDDLDNDGILNDQDTTPYYNAQ